jgi:hypothetical protein
MMKNITIPTKIHYYSDCKPYNSTMLFKSLIHLAKQSIQLMTTGIYTGRYTILHIYTHT